MKYGSGSVGFLLVDGYDLIALTDVHEATLPEPEAVTEESHGLGKQWFEHLATGMRRATAALEALYDDAVDGMLDLLVGGEQTERIVCWSVTGNAVGAKFIGQRGFAGKVRRGLKRAGLTRVNVDVTVSGQVDEGIVLQPLAAKTADWNTEGADSVDHGASTANGGVAYQQVRAMTGFTGFVGKVRHSADDVTYTDLATFANHTAARGAQRVAVNGTVNRHLAYQGDVTGTGSIEVMAGFCRG
jgi:hypothetical protein